MKNLLLSAAILLIIVSSCNEPVVSKEKRPIVAEINDLMSHIDSNHRVRIIEDDFSCRRFYLQD